MGDGERVDFPTFVAEYKSAKTSNSLCQVGGGGGSIFHFLILSPNLLKFQILCVWCVCGRRGGGSRSNFDAESIFFPPLNAEFKSAKIPNSLCRAEVMGWELVDFPTFDAESKSAII